MTPVSFPCHATAGAAFQGALRWAGGWTDRRYAAAAKVLVTNLHNHTQPLIRYELTDRFIRHPALGDPYLHASVEGRADEIFRYGPVTINPLVIRTAMVKTPGVFEYQIRQTDHGIDAAVVADGTLDHAELASSLLDSPHRGPA